jgi:metallo-beta-lactamase class B
VGTYDLASYLIVSREGNILINTGLAESAVQIRKNIEALGFHFNDVKIILTNQVHYDHVGALSAVKAITGAKVYVNSSDAAVLADGGNSDYEMGGKGPLFLPVKADRLLHDSDTVSLGPIRLLALHHPGHTKGSTSYVFEVEDNTNKYKVLIANMPTVIVNDLKHVKKYPAIIADYAKTFAAMKQIDCDIWLAAHASQFDLHEKHKPNDKYNPAAFIDKKGYKEALNDLEQNYLELLKK